MEKSFSLEQSFKFLENQVLHQNVRDNINIFSDSSGAWVKLEDEYGRANQGPGQAQLEGC